MIINFKVVEEAAEVLEGHIVTALCKETEHLILIGDHLQLRPNPSVYELAKKFNLEISMFERFIKNGMDFHQLKLQHRMRPSISSLLVPHIYEELIDHPKVAEYEDIKGISKNLFFVDHRENEICFEGTKTHSNDHEAQFLVALCRYILSQGYEPSQVTILCTYAGQLQSIKTLMNACRLPKVQASSVDNYQGEENDIILLSFVRSNEEGNIGFLKDSHRINVALSRARKGLYCIGNFECLAERCSLWRKLWQKLRAQKAIGRDLEIYCQNHTNNKSLVNSKDDFIWQSPEGGCAAKCTYRLPCGHSCEKHCHFIDAKHKDQYRECDKKCNQLNCESHNHRCQKTCHFGEECGECVRLVKKTRPQCQHIVEVACSCDPSLVGCPIPCAKLRSCGHECKHACSDDCDSMPCMIKINKNTPCGHEISINCSDAENQSKLLNACSEPCNTVLKCEHLCQGTCGQCKLGRLHIR